MSLSRRKGTWIDNQPGLQGLGFLRPTIDFQGLCWASSVVGTKAVSALMLGGKVRVERSFGGWEMKEGLSKLEITDLNLATMTNLLEKCKK